MSETSVLPDLLHSLDVFSDLGLEKVGGGMEGVSFPEVLLSVDKPLRDSVSNWVSDDLSDLLPGLLTDLSGSGVDVDLGDLADQVSKSDSDSSDGGDSVGDLAFSLEVGVKHSDNVLELDVVLVDETLTLII